MKTKFTKIVATVSDRRCDVDFIKQLAENGLNVVRMNSAHIQREGFQRIVNNVRAVSDRIGILMDTKGPEIRTTTNVDDENLSFSAGDKVCVTGAPDELSDKQNIHLSYPDIANDVKAGMHLLIDDGEARLLNRQHRRENAALHGTERWRTRFEKEREHPWRKHQTAVADTTRHSEHRICH